MPVKEDLLEFATASQIKALNQGENIELLQDLLVAKVELGSNTLEAVSKGLKGLCELFEELVKSAKIGYKGDGVSWFKLLFGGFVTSQYHVCGVAGPWQTC